MLHPLSWKQSIDFVVRRNNRYHVSATDRGICVRRSLSTLEVYQNEYVNADVATVVLTWHTISNLNNVTVDRGGYNLDHSPETSESHSFCSSIGITYCWLQFRGIMHDRALDVFRPLHCLVLAPKVVLILNNKAIAPGKRCLVTTCD